jgi:hypothetical protein
MQLLATTPPSELPTDALLARLRSRRAAIDLVAGKDVGAAPGEVVAWVYRRLNRQLRKRLGPFLDLMAMRSLILALRYQLAEEEPPAAVLQGTLLAWPLQEMLQLPEAEATVAGLEAALVEHYPFVAGLAACWRSQGPGGVEQQLAVGILQHGLARSGRGIVSRTLGYLVDMRNCLVIRKFWRWQVNQAPQLIPGGTLPIEALQRIWATRAEDRLDGLVGKLAGTPVRSPAAVAMEQGLLNGLSRLLRRAGRDPLGLAVVIEYLWKSQLAVHNQVLRKTLGEHREELYEEALLL